VSEEKELVAGGAAGLRVVVDAQIVLAMFLARRDDPASVSPKRQLLGLLTSTKPMKSIAVLLHVAVGAAIFGVVCHSRSGGQPLHPICNVPFDFLMQVSLKCFSFGQVRG
jgi:hypothetical protein